MTDMGSKNMAVMSGFPPDPKTAISPENWFDLPYLRWSLMNRSRMVRTVPVARGLGPVSALAEIDQGGLEPLKCVENPHDSLDAQLMSLEIDAFIILHKGRIVYERYFHGMKRGSLHGSASVSKSFLGVLAGIMRGAGELDFEKTSEYYLPEMRGTAMGDATLQQLMDMQAGIQRPRLAHRSPGVGEQDGGVYEIIGLLPHTDTSPRDFYEFIKKKPRSGSHGSFYYDNGPPEALAWIMKRVSGRPLSELLSEMLFEPLGAERDASYTIDNTGAEFASGGLGLTLRDLARFGEMLRSGGFWNNRRLVPEAFLRDTMNGGDRGQFAKTRFALSFPTGSYRNYFYLAHDDLAGFMASGRYGQRLYISPKAEIVIGQFASRDGLPPHPDEKRYAALHQELASRFL